MHHLLVVFCIALFLIILYRLKNWNYEGYSKGVSKGDSKRDSKDVSKGYSDGLCSGSGYKTLNMSSGESPWKCNSCTTYGSLFDYKKQLGDQTYGVHNGCQKIF